MAYTAHKSRCVIVMLSVQYAAGASCGKNVNNRGKLLTQVGRERVSYIPVCSEGEGTKFTTNLPPPEPSRTLTGNLLWLLEIL